MDKNHQVFYETKMEGIKSLFKCKKSDRDKSYTKQKELILSGRTFQVIALQMKVPVK